MTLDPPTIADERPTTPSLPLAAAIGALRICPECGAEFSRPIRGPGQHKRFCSATCRMAWGAREKVQGAAIITAAKIWRKARGSGEVGKLAFARFVETLDVLISDDDASPRPKLSAGGPLAPYIKDVLAEPYLDRRRG